MRILHVIYDDIGNPWVGGGGAYRTLEINSRIARLGHRVLVVCARYPGARTRELRQGVRYRRVGYPGSHMLSRLTFVAGAIRLIKKGGYDIVLEDVTPFSPVGSPLWKAPVPAVASVQNLYGAHATEKYGIAGWGPRLVERPLLSLFTNFVASSGAVAEQIGDMFGARANVRVIRYSASQTFFEAGALPDEEPGDYILSIGRIDVYQKGLDRLLRAFDRLAEQLPSTRLVIAGGGGEMQTARLRQLIAGAKHGDRIEMVGHVDQQRAADLMRRASLLAIPSRYETGPITALEAAAAGVPVVGTSIPGLRDNAPQFPVGHGELVPEDDEEALAAAMVRVATEPGLRRAMVGQGKQWVKRFTWDALAAEQLAFYEQLVRRPG